MRASDANDHDKNARKMTKFMLTTCMPAAAEALDRSDAEPVSAILHREGVNVRHLDTLLATIKGEYRLKTATARMRVARDMLERTIKNLLRRAMRDIIMKGGNISQLLELAAMTFNCVTGAAEDKADVETYWCEVREGARERFGGANLDKFLNLTQQEMEEEVQREQTMAVERKNRAAQAKEDREERKNRAAQAKEDREAAARAKVTKAKRERVAERETEMAAERALCPNGFKKKLFSPKCKRCGKQKSEHRSVPTDLPISGFVCPDCHESFGTADDLKIHVDVLHGKLTLSKLPGSDDRSFVDEGKDESHGGQSDTSTVGVVGDAMEEKVETKIEVAADVEQVERVGTKNEDPSSEAMAANTVKFLPITAVPTWRANPGNMVMRVAEDVGI